MLGTASVNDSAASVKRADLPMVVFIKQPIGSTVRDVDYNAIFVCDLDLALCILEHSAAFADVVGNIAVFGRGSGLCGNERQGMSRMNRFGLLIRADRAGTFHNTVLGAGSDLCDHPFAERMRALVDNVAARADYAYLLVTIVIAGIVDINVLVLCTGVFGIPVAVPLVTLNTGSVRAACVCAAFSTALFAESAVFTDICTFRACSKAVGANVGAVFADIAIVAHKHAVLAIVVAFFAEVCAILATSAVKAHIGAVGASAAVVADDSTFFATVAVRADLHTSTADAAIFAPAVALDAVIAFIAICAEINAVVAYLAAIGTDKRALIAGVAVLADIDTVAAYAAAVAPAAFGSAGIAASANKANVIAIAAGSTALGADAAAFRAAVAIQADVGTIAAGVTVHAPAIARSAIIARSARNAERCAIGARIGAGRAQCSAIIAAVTVAADIGAFAAGIAILAPAVRKSAIIAPSAIIADDRAGVARLSALDADIGASFAAVAVKANDSAVAADIAVFAPTVILGTIKAYAAI